MVSIENFLYICIEVKNNKDIISRLKEDPQRLLAYFEYLLNDAYRLEFEKQTEVQILWSVLNKLNSRERLIMVMRFGLNGDDEKTQKEVADDLGISQSYISRLEKKILSRIKKEILKLA